MPATERCPICDVSVRADNLVRHIDNIHPRHPDVEPIKQRLRQERAREPSKRGAPAFRLRRIHVVVIVAVAVLGLGGYYVAYVYAPTVSVDSCINEVSIPNTAPYHIHPFLEILIRGNRYEIPNGIGISPTCTHPLHTHSDYTPATQPAKIHVETPVARTFTLGDFFHIWGQTLTPTQVLSYANDGTNTVRMTVNGASSTAFASLVLADEQRIEITYGP